MSLQDPAHSTLQEEPAVDGEASGTDAARAGSSGLVLRVRSADEFEFEIPMEAARASRMLMATMPEGIADAAELGDDYDAANGGGVDGVETIDLARVGRKALEKVVEFLKHHVHEPLAEVRIPMLSTTFEEVC
jgi:hypothetical protein